MVKYISSSDAVFAACQVLDKLGGCSMGPFCPDAGCREVREVFENAPAADVVEVRHAHWILHISDIYPADSTMECSSCNEEQPIGTSDSYCPNCGAKMDEEVDDE